MFNNYNFVNNDSFLGSNSDFDSVNSSFDYNSFYRAIVKSNYDPENLGRIRIYIPALHSNLNASVNGYPYAYPACFTGLGNQVGQFFLPPVGSIVFVTFEYSSEHRPIYFGGVPTIYDTDKQQSYGSKINRGLPKTVTTDDIPTEYDGSQAIIYKSPSGAIIYMDDLTYLKKVVIRDAANQYIQMKSYEQNGQTKRFTDINISDDTYLHFDDTTMTLSLDGVTKVYDKDHMPGTGGSESSNYVNLINKPQINGHTLIGNMTASSLGLQETIEIATNSEIDALLD